MIWGIWSNMIAYILLVFQTYKERKDNLKNIEQNKYYIWLSSIDKLSTREKIKLLDKYKDPAILFDKTKKELEKELLDYFENVNKIIKAITNLYYKIRL